MPSTLPLFQVNAFSPNPFQGNPAAVCLLPHYPDPAWMQGVAAQMNLSETAFLVPQALDYQLRWFTPQVEVDLCGHATLAAAHTLFSQNLVAPGQAITFHTRSGPLMARQIGEWIELDFPSQPVRPQAPNPDLINALNLHPSQVVFWGASPDDQLIELSSADEVRACQPNFSALAQLPGRGVMVTSVSDLAEADFVSRFFAPAAGIDEDPVTGSAHCSLYPYWRAKLHRPELVGYQASARGGWVKVRGEGERVILAGPAITVWRGELLLSLDASEG